MTKWSKVLYKAEGNIPCTIIFMSLHPGIIAFSHFDDFGLTIFANEDKATKDVIISMANHLDVSACEFFMV